jgi:hypothetical protein
MEVAMTGRYILIGQTPVLEPDLMTWAAWMEASDRVVTQTELGASYVSTIFLGLDYRLGGDGAPVLFETMIFTDGRPEDYCQRCSTWLEAEAQHARAVATVRARAFAPEAR